MGTINYGSSDIITLGVKPFELDDYLKDPYFVEWAQNFVSFKDWAYNNGYSDELTIDRIDNDGDYEPKNCRWVTTKDQALNTSRNRFISIGGTTKTLTEWCEIYSINYKTVQDRLNRGWEHERAITTPIDRRWSH